MNEQNYIVDNELTLSQNFKLLKQEGLAFIQDHTGTAWTNLNSSDPGVTILDQLCYALTELGYCTGFPVNDLLTDKSGHLITENQFYLPSEILSSTPVTPDDYRKLIIDAVNRVGNVTVIPIMHPFLFVNQSFQVYLKLRNAAEENTPYSDICKQVYYLLNTARNLGCIFEFPKVLSPMQLMVSGEIKLKKISDLNGILGVLRTAVNEYVFPDVNPISYSQALSEGYSVNDIFDGPLLKNGTIPTDILKDKLGTMTGLELTNLISELSMIDDVHLSFESSQSNDQVNPSEDQLITIDWEKSITLGSLKISANGRIFKDPTNSGDQGKTLALTPVLSDQPQNWVPDGTYRDVNSYYSIQNTFPEVYGVGEIHTAEKKNSVETAQVRQLKGYLTLFDQVLANQFSQLANLANLFSFKNATTGTPSDLAAFYAVQDKLKNEASEYPVPYQSFSPTYFYQSLYQVPDVKPLLKDNQIFSYSDELISNKLLTEESWKNYQEDPYNPYIWGLMNLMTDENDNLERRNNILNHLLARHGESSDKIGFIVQGAQYSGNPLKDQVIFKSLYLQNFGLLSYYHSKAYNFLGADPLSATLPKLSDCKDELWMSETSNDFIFNTDLVDEIEKIKQIDFVNSSALELKLSLLFGLKPLYKDYIAENRFSKKESNLFEEEERLLTTLVEQTGITFLLSKLEKLLLKSKGFLKIGAILSEIEVIKILLQERSEIKTLLEKIRFQFSDLKSQNIHKEQIEKVEGFLSDLAILIEAEKVLGEVEVLIMEANETTIVKDWLTKLEAGILKVQTAVEGISLGFEAAMLTWLINLRKETGVLLWLMTNAQGFLMFETALLMEGLPLIISFVDKDNPDSIWRLDQSISGLDLMDLIRKVQTQGILSSENTGSIGFDINGKDYKLTERFKTSRTTEQFSVNIDESVILGVQFEDDTELSIDTFFEDRLILVFPDYVNGINSPEFNERLNLFLEDTLPVQVTYSTLCLSAIEMEILIQLYVAWHNSIRTTSGNGEQKNNDVHPGASLLLKIQHYKSKGNG